MVTDSGGGVPESNMTLPARKIGDRCGSMVFGLAGWVGLGVVVLTGEGVDVPLPGVAGAVAPLRPPCCCWPKPEKTRPAIPTPKPRARRNRVSRVIRPN